MLIRIEITVLRKCQGIKEKDYILFANYVMQGRQVNIFIIIP